MRSESVAMNARRENVVSVIRRSNCHLFLGMYGTSFLGGWEHARRSHKWKIKRLTQVCGERNAGWRWRPCGPEQPGSQFGVVMRLFRGADECRRAAWSALGSILGRLRANFSEGWADGSAEIEPRFHSLHKQEVFMQFMHVSIDAHADSQM